MTVSPVELEITQENSSCPDIRFAERSGSIAQEKATIEKLGTNRNPTFNAPALLLA
jgi:hypothetical protein